MSTSHQWYLIPSKLPDNLLTICAEVQYLDIRTNIRRGTVRYKSFELPPRELYISLYNKKIIIPLMLKPGLEAYKDSVREVSDLLSQRCLENLREVEVMLMGCVEPGEFHTPVAQAFLSMVASLCSELSPKIDTAGRDSHFAPYIAKMRVILLENENDEHKRSLLESLASNAAFRDVNTSPSLIDTPTRTGVNHHNIVEQPWNPSTIAPATLMLSAPHQQIEQPTVGTEIIQTFPPLSDNRKLYCSIQGCRMNTKGFKGPLKYQRSNLARHMKTHNRHNPWLCPDCLQHFTRADNLKKHRRIACRG